jgi:hypothetical protein
MFEGKSCSYGRSFTKTEEESSVWKASTARGAPCLSCSAVGNHPQPSLLTVHPRQTERTGTEWTRALPAGRSGFSLRTSPSNGRDTPAETALSLPMCRWQERTTSGSRKTEWFPFSVPGSANPMMEGTLTHVAVSLHHEPSSLESAFLADVAGPSGAQPRPFNGDGWHIIPAPQAPDECPELALSLSNRHDLACWT